MTVRWLLKTPASDGATGPRTVLCTGETMGDLIVKLYPGVRATTYEPRHNQDRLSNQFRCFASYTSDIWDWR